MKDAEIRLQQAEENRTKLVAARDEAKKALAAMTPVDIEAGKDLQAKLEKSQEINRQVDRAEPLEVNLSVASDRAPPTWDRLAAHPHGGTRGVIRPPNLVGILSKAIGSEPSRRPFKEVQATGRKLKTVEHAGMATTEQDAIEHLIAIHTARAMP